MAENSNISWTDHTFNPWVGCTKVSPACDHCYAESWAKRAGKAAGVVWGGERRRTKPSNWAKPLRWNAQAEREGRRLRVFCSSLADVFDNQVPPEWRRDLFNLILSTPHLDWLLLTKRIGNAARMIEETLPDSMKALPADHPLAWPWPHVWIGATVCNQKEADRDIIKLMRVPASVRFLSIEPMLAAINLEQACDIAEAEVCRGTWSDMADPQRCMTSLRKGSVSLLDWVIVGGESGPGARPMHPDWARSIRDQCAEAGVPFHFKQWGEWLPGENEPHPSGRQIAHHQDGRWGSTDTKVNSENYVAWDASGSLYRGSLLNAPLTLRVAAWAERVGTQAAGRLLDGKLHNDFPSTTESFT